MIYTSENISKLIEKVQLEKNYADYLKDNFEKIKTELQVHTKGKLFSKVISVFKNESEENSKYVLDTYEAITKGSIHRGIDNLSRIFNNTGFNITGDPAVIKELSDIDFFAHYIDSFINVTTTLDPNSVQVWIKDGDGWRSKFIKTDFIRTINDDEICFIDEENSDYTLVKKHTRINSIRSHQWEKSCVDQSFNEGVEYKWGDKRKYIYISKFQYIEVLVQGSNAEVIATDFPKPIESPYAYTGVEKIEKGVYHSPVAGFIPFGNIALIQHRTFRSVEAIFGYPRMSEVEMPCDKCTNGVEYVDICEEYPSGERVCHTCKGTGQVSLQSPFKIYKRKISPDTPDQNLNIPVVEFYTPDINILNYNANAWRTTLQMGEDAIYIQQRVETGNVESAKSREKQLESMYAWLGRISDVIFANIQRALDNYCTLTGTSKVTVNKPISFAIMSELEAFQYLSQIVSTDAPVFIKTTHIENFLNKYISKTSPVIKIVEILKRVDPFVFYATKDLQTLSDSGVINDKDWRVHSYAFPMLMMMYTKNPELFDDSYERIEAALMSELNKKMGTSVNESQGGGNNDQMINGVIDILNQIQDPVNRQAVLDQQVANWDSEGIDYNLTEIKKAVQLS